MRSRNTAVTTIAVIVLAILGIAALLSATGRLRASRTEIASGSAGMVSSRVFPFNVNSAMSQDIPINLPCVNCILEDKS